VRVAAGGQLRDEGRGRAAESVRRPRSQEGIGAGHLDTQPAARRAAALTDPRALDDRHLRRLRRSRPAQAHPRALQPRLATAPASDILCRRYRAEAPEPRGVPRGAAQSGLSIYTHETLERRGLAELRGA